MVRVKAIVLEDYMLKIVAIMTLFLKERPCVVIVNHDYKVSIILF